MFREGNCMQLYLTIVFDKGMNGKKLVLIVNQQFSNCLCTFLGFFSDSEKLTVETGDKIRKIHVISTDLNSSLHLDVKY